MDIQGKHVLPLTPEKAWAALNSTRMLEACIPGCEAVTQTGDNTFEVIQRLAIAGHETRFTSELVLEDVDPPHSYVLRFSGNGGQGGFGVGHALIALRPESEGTRLNYQADIQVGGRLAQIGHGAVEGAVRVLIDDFFSRFERTLRGEHARLAPKNAVERVWFMLPPWAWAFSTLLVVFVVYTAGAHSGW